MNIIVHLDIDCYSWEEWEHRVAARRRAMTDALDGADCSAEWDPETELSAGSRYPAICGAYSRQVFFPADVEEEEEGAVCEVCQMLWLAKRAEREKVKNEDNPHD